MSTPLLFLLLLVCISQEWFIHAAEEETRNVCKTAVEEVDVICPYSNNDENAQYRHVISGVAYCIHGECNIQLAKRKRPLTICGIGIDEIEACDNVVSSVTAYAPSSSSSTKRTNVSGVVSIAWLLFYSYTNNHFNVHPMC